MIADGLFQHYTRPATPQNLRGGHRLPNITCPRCTLQEFNSWPNHASSQPGGYSYHHCADLQITADPSKPVDPGWPAVTTTVAQ